MLGAGGLVGLVMRHWQIIFCTELCEATLDLGNASHSVSESVSLKLKTSGIAGLVIFSF